MEASVASIALGDEIKPYKIHVSSKYLELTRKKLELTRLPHEVLLPREREWEDGTPKSEIEPLIDYWLEQYSWRTRETHLNSSWPQFRTALKVSGSNVPLRVHFLHIRSSYGHAIPLLLIPAFPLTNLSLTPLFDHLTDPASPTSTQPFHLVVPSIPGLGFSDAFNTPENSMLASTAELFNTLMTRLGYEHYLASSTGAGKDSPAEIDYHLTRLIAERFPQNCLGAHLIAPPLEKPSLRREPWMWAKFAIANFFHAPIFGYDAADFAALAESAKVAREATQRRTIHTNTSSMPRRVAGSRYAVAGHLGLREPNTLSYALCDSPVGLLSLVCSALRRRNPEHSLSNTEVIDVTQLSWLPGPEAAARFWASAVKEVQTYGREEKTPPRVAITVFGSDGLEDEPYTCPAWASSKHDVLFAQRATGRAGLVPWERTQLVVDGIRGLANGVVSVDGRLNVRALEEVVVAGQETIVEEEERIEAEEEEDHGMQLDVESPATVVAAAL